MSSPFSGVFQNPWSEHDLERGPLEMDVEGEPSINRSLVCSFLFGGQGSKTLSLAYPGYSARVVEPEPYSGVRQPCS